MIHVGSIIKETLKKKGKSVTWFANEMCCTRTNVYKIFRKKSIDTDIIWRASQVLEYDFFAVMSQKLSQ